MELLISYKGITYHDDVASLLERGVPQLVIDETISNLFVQQAENRIDQLCDQVYARHASRTARYEQKHQEAKAYATLNYPANPTAADYPYLVAEAPARSLTHHELADLIIAKATAFNTFGAQAEAARAQVSTDIAAAADETAKQAVITAALDTLKTAAAALA